jgi:hypothetical protein
MLLEGQHGVERGDLRMPDPSSACGAWGALVDGQMTIELDGEPTDATEHGLRRQRDQLATLLALAQHGQCPRLQVQMLEVDAGQLTPAQAQVEGQAEENSISSPR